MAVENKDIVFFGSATMPDTDTTTQIGGAIDKTVKMTWADLQDTAQIEIVSSAAGDTTQDVICTFRNAAGEKVAETLNLNGQTPVSSSASGERLLKAVKQATCSGDVAVMSTTNLHTGTAVAGGTDFLDLAAAASGTDGAYDSCVIRITSGTGANQIREVVRYEGSGGTNPKRAHVRNWDVTPDATSVYEVSEGMVMENSLASTEVLECRRIFYDAGAEPAGGSQKKYYEKVFAYNDHATLALTNATISEVAEGIAAKVHFELESSLNGSDDNGVGNNRLVAPGGYTFDSATENVANSQNFSPGAGQGIWLELTLDAGDAAQNSYEKLQVQGQSI